MVINIEIKEDHCRIVIDGEMTIFVASEIKTVLEEPLAKSQEVDIDLSQVSEIDSAGLQIMLMAKIESLERGMALRFTGHSEAVQEMLDLTDLVSFFGDPLVIQA